MKYGATANGHNVSALTLMGVEAYHNFSETSTCLIKRSILSIGWKALKFAAKSLFFSI
jgi:hypothetical protein